MPEAPTQAPQIGSAHSAGLDIFDRTVLDIALSMVPVAVLGAATVVNRGYHSSLFDCH